MLLSVCMIAKNEERTLPRSLSSIRPHVDQIVVVDTGSTDATKDVARSFGADVYDFTPETHPESFYLDDESSGGPGPYTNQMQLANFAAARNYSFDKASGMWLMWLDCDDEVKQADQIKPFVSSINPKQSVMARYQLTPTFSLQRERVVHRLLGARWVGACHEVLVGANVRIEAPFWVEHHQDQQRKGVSARNFKALHREVSRLESSGQKPEPRTLFYYAQETSYLDALKGVGVYDKYLRAGGWPEERLVARLRAGMILEQLDPPRAIEHYSAAAAYEMPHFPDGWFGLGRVSYYKNDWVNCVRFMEKGLSLGDPPWVMPADRLDRTLRPYWFYNVALWNVGRRHDALKACLKGLEADPGDKFLVHNRNYYQAELDKEAVSPTGG